MSDKLVSNQIRARKQIFKTDKQDAKPTTTHSQSEQNTNNSSSAKKITTFSLPKKSYDFERFAASVSMSTDEANREHIPSSFRLVHSQSSAPLQMHTNTNHSNSLDDETHITNESLDKIQNSNELNSDLTRSSPDFQSKLEKENIFF